LRRIGKGRRATEATVVVCGRIVVLALRPAGRSAPPSTVAGSCQGRCCGMPRVRLGAGDAGAGAGHLHGPPASPAVRGAAQTAL